MSDDIDVAAVTKVLNDPSVPIELRNEILNDWVAADPRAEDTWGPLVDSNGLTLTDDSKRLAGFPFAYTDEDSVKDARSRLQQDVETGNQVSAAHQRSSDLASSTAGVSTSDELLDQASDGLRYFDVFLPLYARVQSTGAMSTDTAHTRFDESRDMNFATLRSDGAMVSAAGTTLAPEQRCIDNQSQNLAPAWKGGAATAARKYLGTFSTDATSVTTWLGETSSGMTQGADQLEASVRTKAVAISGLYIGQVGGKTPDQIDTIITVMQGKDYTSDNDDTIKAMSQWFPGIKIDERCMNDDLTDDTRAAAIQSCRDFITTAFLPAVETTWKTLIDTCDTCDTSVKAIYKVITDALDKVDLEVFASLDGGIPPAPAENKHGGNRNRNGNGNGNGSRSGTPSVSGSVPTAGGGGGDTPPGGSAPAPPVGNITPGAAPTAAQVTSQGVGNDETTGPGPASGLTPTTVPAGLPTGAGWISDPTTLPKGWTVDATTGELLPPHSPGGKGDPEVHSAAANELLDGDGKGDLGSTGAGGHGGADGSGARPSYQAVSATSALDPATGLPTTASDPATGLPATASDPATGLPATASDPATGLPATASDPATGLPATASDPATGPSGLGATGDGVTGSTITVTDDGVSMQISAEDGGGAGAHIDVTDSTGQVSGYRVEIGADGAPQLVPDSTPSDVAATPAATAGGATGAAQPIEAAAGAAGVSSTTADASFAGAPASVDTAFSAPVDAGGGAAADGGGPAATESSGPVPAQVHTAAVGGSWVDPTGSATGGGSGAQLASAHSGADATTVGPSGAQLAGAGHDGSAAAGDAAGSGMTGMAGAGGGGGPGGESQEHRVSEQWRVLDDTFDDDSGTWATLADVLGPRDRQAAGEQENR